MISLYIHIPFCRSKCLYCGFYSTQYVQAQAEDYLLALNREMEQYRAKAGARQIASIYIGGGTPTTLSATQLTRLFSMIRTHLAPDFPQEVSIEMNPGTASSVKLELLKLLGITRLSIGIQSFDNELLCRLGRTHTAEGAQEAFRMARNAGFESIGLDLIYGIPGQRLDEWRETLTTAIALGPEHVSLYCLSLDEGSRLAADVRAGRLSLPSDDRTADIYETSRRKLLAAGYEQYELSNFARPSHACRHNLHYWKRGEYLGFGPSAWSFLGNRRWMNVRDLRNYTERSEAGSPLVGEEETISASQAAAERLFLGLRMTEGISLPELAWKFDQRSQRISLEDRIRSLAAGGLVTTVDGRLRLTPRGMLVSNEVMEHLTP